MTRLCPFVTGKDPRTPHWDNSITSGNLNIVKNCFEAVYGICWFCVFNEFELFTLQLKGVPCLAKTKILQEILMINNFLVGEWHHHLVFLLPMFFPIFMYIVSLMGFIQTISQHGFDEPLKCCAACSMLLSSDMCF